MSGLSKGLRVVGFALAGVAFWHAIRTFDQGHQDLPVWKFLAASLALSILWQWRIDSRPAPEAFQPVEPGSWPRITAGLVLALGGAAFFGRASFQLHIDWAANFDEAWLTWVAAATAIGIGLDLAWGRWPRPSGLWSRHDLAIVSGLFVAGAVLRAYGLVEFPGPYHVSQIEEAQIGNFGFKYLAGNRIRWEFLSHMWLSALGQALFENDLVSVRIPFVAVHSLKLIPFYFWLRWLIGRPGAVAGTALLACSGWDVMLSRIPTNQNEITTAVAFALMAGPARRGRPSAFVFLGLIAGYVAYEYIAYRPLALLILGGTVLLSLNDRSVGWGRRLLRPAVTLVLALAVAAPLFTGKLTRQVAYQYLDGWNRARAQRYHSENTDWQGSIEKRKFRLRRAYGSLFFSGDPGTVRNLDRRPVLDRATSALFLAGVGFSLTHWMWGMVPLSLLGFLVTFTGTLVATGNFDMARAGCNVVYTHALAGFGAAGVAALLRSLLASFAWRSAIVAVVLAAIVGVAGFSNLRFLDAYWHSPEVRRAQHLELAYQMIWLKQNVRSGERVVGLSSRQFNVLMPHDASWIGSGRVEGNVFGDLWATIEELRKHPDEDVALYVAVGAAGPEAVAFFRTIWPELSFEYSEHPEYPGQGFYFTHIAKESGFDPNPPTLAQARCRSPLGEFVVHFEVADDKFFPTRFPFVDRSTWPHRLRGSLWHLREKATGTSLTLSFDFAVEKPGVYLFRTRSREGSPEITVAGRSGKGEIGVSAKLSAGTHRLELTGEFLPTSVEPETYLEWRGPDPGDEYSLMPIFELAPADLDCSGVGLDETL